MPFCTQTRAASSERRFHLGFLVQAPAEHAVADDKIEACLAEETLDLSERLGM